MGSFENCMRRYADLIVRQGMNVQPDQEVVVSGEICHREICLLVAEQAYRAGARHVSLEFIDARAEALHARMAPPAGLSFVPKHLAETRNELVESLGAVVRIDGPEDPKAFAGIDPQRISAIQTARRKAREAFYEEGINRGKVQWCVAAGASAGWARELFPEMSEEKALSALWGHLFKIARVDTDNYLERWREHDALLHSRAQKLDAMEIDELHFSGPGTDLRVGLSPLATFGGGSKKSARGELFTANLPTEEVFTTPDARRTQGTVRVTRPVMVNRTMVKDLSITFDNGAVTAFEAGEGREAFAAMLDVDSGARLLGEVALVGIDSPVYQSGVVFQEILLDENASCHVAIGSAYKTKLRGSAEMTAAEFAAAGCNESAVHVDFMISSEQVDVTAHTRTAGSIPLLRSGLWCLS